MLQEILKKNGSWLFRLSCSSYVDISCKARSRPKTKWPATAGIRTWLYNPGLSLKNSTNHEQVTSPCSLLCILTQKKTCQPKKQHLHGLHTAQSLAVNIVCTTQHSYWANLDRSRSKQCSHSNESLMVARYHTQIEEVERCREKTFSFSKNMKESHIRSVAVSQHKK